MPALNFSEKEKLAIAIAKSGLFGMKTPDQALVLMALCEAEGLHPAIAVRDYHIIQGRPALKSDAMLARFQAAGGKVNWSTYTDTEVSGTFSHPQGGSATVTWTIEQAKNAGLTSKDNWRMYPRAMLRARVISEGIRTVYPGVSVGVYTPEEIEDFDAKPATKDVKAEDVKPAPKAPATDPVRDSLFNKLQYSKWTKEQLRSYAVAVFNKESSADLSNEELELIVNLALSTDFKKAMEDLISPSFLDDEEHA